MNAEQAVEQAYRDEWSRLLALLVTRLRRFDLAEDSLQDAFEAAARVWPADGVPARPAAWLFTAAHRRALDRIRREAADARRLPLLITEPAEVVEEIPDERLRLLFACCHPALKPEARAALMLRFVAGLTTAEIARLFVVSEPTMAARLTRAKAKMAVAGIPLRKPSAEDLPERLDVVLKVIYLVFTEGYRATAGPSLVRPELAGEAIRLGYLTGQLLPEEPKIAALLALMVLQHARRDARVDADGALVLLPDQDRGRWHRDEIARGLALLDVLEAAPMPGEYHLQALIAAEHAKPPPTDWPRIARLYAELERRTGSPVVRLNRAVAIAESGSPEAGLALLDGLKLGGHLLPAVRAELLTRLGRSSEAVEAFDQALALARTEPERAHLRRRLDVVTKESGL
ncbi:sigma-70 family RNA polymerase sigma factor [Actinoplanes sp. TBRC 11911]|uniref:RNA polymerase sigma factor n=1 Tax=Actinoplanes sp. TBRC 11911 TaxID=2729386 RepID=UPI00145D663B|nr:sigma-70 family RNA polymerase sigma factor [Actinoplanes sp. TBRC 11911]NMO55101.1 sigma-70 family RNA polymerase sigma factor [Actinoplanes sp. TBRC 11911]